LNLKTDLFPYVFSGAGVKKFFQKEVGTHTWQRVPPTEKRGRMQTSSISVAVLEKAQYNEVEIRPDEVTTVLTKGDGNGGQHRDKTMSCVIMTHTATGIQVTKKSRNQHRNKKDAFKEISKRVNDFYKGVKTQEESDERKEQFTDQKRRSYRVKDGVVIDHLSGKTAKLKDVLRGKVEKLS